MLRWIGLLLMFVGTLMMNGEGKRNLLGLGTAGIGGVMSGGAFLERAFVQGKLTGKASLIFGIALAVIGVICLFMVLMDLPYLSHPETVALHEINGGRSSSDEGIGYFISGRKENGLEKSFRISHKTFKGLNGKNQKAVEIEYLPHTDTVLQIHMQ